MAKKLDRIEVFSRLAQVTAVIIGIATGLYSLISSQYERRITKVGEFGKEYASELRRDFQGLVADWNRHARANGGVRDRPEEKVREILNLFFENPDREKKLINLVDFFESVSSCVRGGACDRNAALDLFDRHTDQTWESFGLYITDRRIFEPKFGAGLEALYSLTPETALAEYIWNIPSALVRAAPSANPTSRAQAGQ